MIKTITYNPETHVLVPLEPSNEMCDAATADSCWENMNPPPSTAYRLMIAAAPQPEPVDVDPVGYVDYGDRVEWHKKPAPETDLYTTPQPDRTAELEAELAASQAREQQLREALRKLACLGNGDSYGNSIGNCIAQEALAKINEVLHD